MENTLTKRERFAGQALTGILAKIGGIHYLNEPEKIDQITEEAFQFADSMIKQSKKTNDDSVSHSDHSKIHSHS